MVRSLFSVASIPLIFIVLAQSTLADEPPRAGAPKAKLPEFVEMLGAIVVNGSNMGPNSGWFHPSQSRYGWGWLSARFDLNKDGVVTADELKGRRPCSARSTAMATGRSRAKTSTGRLAPVTSRAVRRPGGGSRRWTETAMAGLPWRSGRRHSTRLRRGRSF